MVKKSYTIIIDAVSEVECGCENLWRRGSSNGRRNYPNFGQYMNLNYFKVFMSPSAYCFCEKTIGILTNVTDLGTSSCHASTSITREGKIY